MLQLSRGHKPARPESRPIQDPHWTLIELCWSTIDQRPAVEDVVSSLKDSLRFYPTAQPLRAFLDVHSPSAMVPLLSATHQQGIHDLKDKPIQDCTPASRRASMSRNTTSTTLRGDIPSQSGVVGLVGLIRTHTVRANHRC